MSRNLVVLLALLALGCPRSQSTGDAGPAGVPDVKLSGETRAPLKGDGSGSDSETAAPAGPVLLDILFVVDNSSGMCKARAGLRAAVSDLLTGLEKLPGLNLRIAATTAEVADLGGRFFKKVEIEQIPACAEHKHFPCLVDQDCADEFGEGWECQAFSANQMYNVNGSVNSRCIFLCGNDLACCTEFCHADDCGDDVSCLEEMCADIPSAQCLHECVGNNVGDLSACLVATDTAHCPPTLPEFLTNENLDLLKCMVSPAPQQTYGAEFEAGLKAAWLALDPKGPNAGQAQGFMRPDAYLLIVIVSDEDDCSISDDFCSPNWLCESDDDCPSWSTCKLDKRFSQLRGKEKKLCCGALKKDYSDMCPALGDYKGATHHDCAYDLSCSDCETDEDCEYGWYCKQGKKCRPEIYPVKNISTYQAPPGTPIFSLTPVGEYYGRYKSLKEDPTRVMVAAIVGDGLPLKDDKEALISDECMQKPELHKCQLYAEQKAASPECAIDPAAAGCEQYLEAKLDCIRECYTASTGDPQGGTAAALTQVCIGAYATTDAGLRYIRLVEMFGPNGILSNICPADAFEKAMADIAEMVVSVVK